MKRTLLIIGLLFSTLSLFAGQYTIGTWNMKWLGGSEGKLYGSYSTISLENVKTQYIVLLPFEISNIMCILL